MASTRRRVGPLAVRLQKGNLTRCGGEFEVLKFRITSPLETSNRSRLQLWT